MIKPYYQEPGIVIYNADCRDVLPQLEPVDLVLTSPPFNVGMEYEIDLWESVKDYHSWLLQCLTYSVQRLASGGWIIVEMGDGFVSPEHSHALPGQREQWCMGTSARIVSLFLDLGIYYKGETIWNRGRWINNAAGRLTCANGSPAILVQHSKVVFARRPGGRTGVGSFDPSLNRLKSIWCRSVWDHIQPESDNRHPAVMPQLMASGIIKMWTIEGHTVIDPFCGRGTVLRAAKDLGRKAIGIEIEKKYCDIAIDRLRQGVLL